MGSESAEKVIFVMGVSGSGKTTIGRLLAEELAIPFIDADDHHPPANIEKMSKGSPLDDTDRRPWLKAMNGVAREHIGSGCVIACSALKKEYRRELVRSIGSAVIWVYLKGTFDQIVQRIKNRKGHFMGEHMLTSQFDTLQEPEDAIVVDIIASPEGIVEMIKSQIA